MPLAMKGGTLEVLLVSAEGLRNPNFIGKPSYYVVIQCGNQELRSKIASGEHKKAFWNEKFVFKFSFSDWHELAHLKLKIIDTSTFSDGNFIGETIIHLGGVITEGTDKGFIELKPAPYNVVLEDDRYKGEIKIGLKFIKTVDVQTENRECINHEKKSARSVFRTILSLWIFQRWRIFHFQKKLNQTDKRNKQ